MTIKKSCPQVDSFQLNFKQTIKMTKKDAQPFCNKGNKIDKMKYLVYKVVQTNQIY